MANRNIEENIQEEDYVLSEEKNSSFEIVDEKETSPSIFPAVLIYEENVTSVVVEKKINSSCRCIKQASTTATKSFICEVYK